MTSLDHGDTAHNKNPLNKKLQKILNPKFLSDIDTQDALLALSDFFPENNVRSRRKLRSDTELRGLRLNEEFLASLETVNSALEQLSVEVKSIDSCYKDMTARLGETRERCAEVLEQTATLQKEMQQVEKRSLLLDAFCHKFQLSSQETQLLEQADEVGPSFFQALRKVQHIHTDCQTLIRSSDLHVGLEIMESMAGIQERAYENLFRWCQRTCRSFTGEFPVFTHELKNALQIVSQREALRVYVLDDYVTTRRSSLVRSFIDSLTLGGPGGNPKPIEMHSHDPVRYASDLLGWLHQAMASENELLVALLLQDIPDSVVSVDKSEIPMLLNRICEGASHMVKVRLEQILSNVIDSMDLFRISNNIRFYQNVYHGFLGDNSELLKFVADMYELSLKLFAKHLNGHASKLLESVSEPPFDLEPTIQFTESLTLLRSILSLENTSVAPLEGNRPLLHTIYESLVAPLIEYATISASLDSTLSQAELLIYQINCCDRLHQGLALYYSTGEETGFEKLLVQLQTHQDRLIQEQASFFLSKAKLNIIHMHYLTADKSYEGALSLYSGLESDSLLQAILSLQQLLALPDQHPIPQLDCLRSKKIRDYILGSGMRLVCDFYTSLHSSISDPSNGYGDLKDKLHQPSEIEHLLL
ncbi:oligomeric Golgi complex subunit 6 [Oopsacas minuta]|uniref:Conserved oligomeric Golgi complex subunit 6 n=1 Tax=Oopsacas minuta TaxID=111878 RepID=A0AAV7KFF5_9METZ|nr:oligomeric Golgi complex subunit 6 [Oopsacas minuta]